MSRTRVEYNLYFFGYSINGDYMKLLFTFIISFLILTSPVFAYEVKESTNKYTYKIDIYETPFPNVNEKIKSWLNKELENFKQYENFNDIKNDFYTDYELHEYNGIYYLQYSIYSYTGGVHYFLINKQFTYNKDGRMLELKDFFGNDNYLEFISKYSYEELVKIAANEDKNWLKEGTKPLIENFSLYYFDKDGLHITFPPYQVASWSSGAIKITISNSKLSSLIKPVDN